MSKLENTRYLETAMELFDSSMKDGDVLTATAVLADLRDNGFTKEAAYLQKKIAGKPKSVMEIMQDATDATIHSEARHDKYLSDIAEGYGGEPYN